MTELPEMAGLPPLLTVQEVADFLQVHRATVYREADRGKLNLQKSGGLTRIRRSELDRYLRANERTSAA